ncbi:MAG: hypothetical protein IPP09_06725 [Elusimicrobia bacterium]|nr:hypothetical protein [Elusimicrobiota bacterium]
MALAGCGPGRPATFNLLLQAVAFTASLPPVNPANLLKELALQTAGASSFDFSTGSTFFFEIFTRAGRNNPP